MFIKRVNGIEYHVLEDLEKYSEDAANLVKEGGEWSRLDGIKIILKKTIFSVLAIKDKKLIGVFFAKNKRGYKDTHYCVGGLLSVKEEFRGKRIASNLIKIRDSWANKHNISITVATIKPKNIASMKCCLKEGYKYWNDVKYTESFFEHRFYKASSKITEDDLKNLFGDPNPQSPL